jgi:hypothetical protein
VTFSILEPMKIFDQQITPARQIRNSVPDGHQGGWTDGPPFTATRMPARLCFITHSCH